MPIVFAVTLCGITVISLIAPVVPEIARDLGLSDLQAGLIVAGASMPGVIVAPLVGVLADRLGRRIVLVACLVTFGIAGGISALASSYAMLLPLRIIQGAGGAGLINLSVVIIGDNFTGTERARWIGFNSAVLTVGITLSSQIGGLLAIGGHWRRAFLPYLLALPVAAWVWLRLPDRREEVASTLGEYMRGGLRYALKPASLALFLSGTVTFVLIFGVVLFLFVFKLDDQFGLAPVWIGVYLAGGALFAGGAAALAGRLHARYSPRALIAVGFGAFGFGYVVMAFGGTLSLMAIAVVLFSIGEGITIPTMQTVSTRIAPEQYRGALVALFTGAARFGQTIGPVIAAALLAGFGSTFAIAAGAALAGGWAVGIAVAGPRQASEPAGSQR